MKRILHHAGLGVMAILLASCSALNGGAPSPAAATPSPSAATPTAAASPGSSPQTLEIWLPPAFDPAAETEAGALLAARLAAFGERNPGVRVTVRIKAESGPAGLLESLAAAASAAPLALPDLVALTPAQLQSAIGRGTVWPLDEHLTEDLETDWYAFAQDFAQHNNQTYALPFAADALALAYSPAILETPPTSWAASLEHYGPLAFAAADPRALYPLVLYLGRGGQLADDNGRPTLEQEQLRAVLAYFEQASQTGLMPVALTQYDSPSQAWTAVNESRASMAVVWYSALLQNNPNGLQPAALPTHNGQPFTLATGWAWAVSSPEAGRQALAVELAEFLTAPEFLAAWCAAAGQLPPRPGATQPESLAAQLLATARLLPDPTLLDRASPEITEAVLAVLKRESSPDEAAAEAVEAFGP